MIEKKDDRDENGINWLYARAHQYPLLTLDEEYDQDRAKWGAVDQLQVLMLQDEAGRHLLQQWAVNLAHNPPCLESFEIRDHYNLLKREHSAVLASDHALQRLTAATEQLSASADAALDSNAIRALQLTGPLVVGLAEVLLGQPDASSIASALGTWRAAWLDSGQCSDVLVQPTSCRALRRSLRDYYDARATLIMHNLRLVYAIAGKLNGRGLSYDDMVQGGMPGLIRAAEKFNYHRGYRFSTYAYNWIRQSMQQQIEDSQGILRYPPAVHEQISRLYRERINYEVSQGEEPTARWLSQQLGLEPDVIEQLRQVSNVSVSLDTPRSNADEGLTLADILPETTYPATASEAENHSLSRQLMQTFSVLKPIERDVLLLRWGLGNTTPHSRRQVADKMQVSTEWVRQLEKAALEKLKHNGQLQEAYADYLSSA